MVAVGQTLVVLTRNIDLSVGSIVGFTAYFTGAQLAAHAGLPPVVAVLVAIVLGGLMGAINGALVAGLRLPSIVVTLATMVTWREGLRWARQGVWVDLPNGVQWFGLSLSR